MGRCTGEIPPTGAKSACLDAFASLLSGQPWASAPPAAGVPLTFVGEAVEGRQPPKFIGPDGNSVVFERGAYSHF